MNNKAIISATKVGLIVFLYITMVVTVFAIAGLVRI